MLCLQSNVRGGSFLQTCINFVEQQLKFCHFEGNNALSFIFSVLLNPPFLTYLLLLIRITEKEATYINHFTFSELNDRRNTENRHYCKLMFQQESLENKNLKSKKMHKKIVENHIY